MSAIITLAVVAIAIVAFISIYNGLVAGRNQFKNAFAQIDVQLQRRYDLIPNLVEAAKGYMQHERETLDAVISARNLAHSAARTASARPDQAGNIGALGNAEGALSGALGRFMAVAEAYPELKANANVQQLMEELTSTENKVSFARQHFNDAVTDYNNRREQFPNNVLAGMFNFDPGELLVMDDPVARAAPKVSFS